MPQLEHIEAIEKRLWTAADKYVQRSYQFSHQYALCHLQDKFGGIQLFTLQQLGYRHEMRNT